MHGKSLEFLCMPKCLGGMGFGDLRVFNKVLLAANLELVIVIRSWRRICGAKSFLMERLV